MQICQFGLELFQKQTLGLALVFNAVCKGNVISLVIYSD